MLTVPIVLFRPIYLNKCIFTFMSLSVDSEKFATNRLCIVSVVLFCQFGMVTVEHVFSAGIMFLILYSFSLPVHNGIYE